MERFPGTGGCLVFVENTYQYLFSQSSSRDKVVAPVTRPRGPSFTGANERHQSLKPLSTEGSFIPGEKEEDGQLRREYVLVDDTRAVENHIPAPTTITRPENPSNTLNGRLPPRIPHTDEQQCMASRAASNALNRTLSLASKKLFGHSSSGHSRASPSRDQSSVPSSPRRPQIITLDGEGERDPLEDDLLSSLEELAQKTDVLTHWADEMYEYVEAVPQKPLPDPTKFIKREGEAEKHGKRRKHADIEAEYNAVTCVAVYMLLMSFSQKGINKLRNFQEHMKMRHPDGNFVVSDGFDDGKTIPGLSSDDLGITLCWFKDHFMKCNDRAALVKTWLPVQYDGPKSWLDQLVYDRALVLSRTAARKELLDQATSPDECEKLYEESLWCLYALQDDLLQTGNPYMDEGRETISTWIKRTKLRLLRCRARMGMNDHDRLNDARADQNLADVARIPAPWEAKPISDTSRNSPTPTSS
ncbi:uncharacterized protein LACBIDRAFT_304881 [Laccaria bicolor S238N-H82]|uniref:Predicted protein n=1 Tax=Laccaria bicolor (strain S238N-H82 / ATCC MYA-4686) TaxID=486041 RepID=B0DMJ8_LACBS|nr:uncharacterized protein LACBIDRAFT_304881 [Laccaria bicolor S238N-H82]EDR04199.1 predicted protein [Laccaria bicolor S238N-H82]|eukprot:XP_001885090.1 predicted protein [Laccaria bicolor S238N-H82]